MYQIDLKLVHYVTMNTIQLNPDVPLNIREQLNGLPSDETFRRKLEDQN